MDEHNRRQETGDRGMTIAGRLQETAISGLGWSVLSQVGQQAVQFAVTAILARMLNPSDFGIMAMVMIFVGFLRSIGDLSLNSALVQKHNINRQHYDSVFWLTVLSGTSLSLLFIILSPLVADFFGHGKIQILCIALSSVFFLTSCATVQQAILQKNMYFHPLAKTELIAAIVGGGAATICAYKGAGIWSLVIHSIVTAAVSTSMLWFYCRWRPAFSISLEALKDLYQYSLNLLGFNVINYVVRNSDNLLVGKFLGSLSLGFYSMAYNLMALPVYQINNITSRVMFPALASIQYDIERVRDIYLKSARIIAFTTFPFMVGMLVVAKPLVLLVYGEKWLPVVPLFQLLCLAGVLQPVGATVGWLFTSQGRTDLLFKFGVYSGIVYVVSFAIGLQWGVTGVALAYVFSNYVFILYPSWDIPGKIIGLRFPRMIGNLLPVLITSIFVGGIVWWVNGIIASVLNPVVTLFLDALVGIGLYLAISIFYRLQAYAETKEFFGELLRRCDLSGCGVN